MNIETLINLVGKMLESGEAKVKYAGHIEFAHAGVNYELSINERGDSGYVCNRDEYTRLKSIKDRYGNEGNAEYAFHRFWNLSAEQRSGMRQLYDYSCKLKGDFDCVKFFNKWNNVSC